MNDFLAIEKVHFANHLMHEQLASKTHHFLFTNFLKHVDLEELNGLSNLFAYYTLL